MAGFTFKKHSLGADNPQMVTRAIANSETVTVGDAVKFSSGYLAVCDANDRIAGFVVGIVDANGIDLDNTASSNYDGTWDSANQTYTAAADNVTDKKVKAIVIMDKHALMLNDADEAMTEAMVGLHFSLINEDQVDGNSNSATVGELVLWEVDPLAEGDLSKGLFSISAWQLDAFEPET